MDLSNVYSFVIEILELEWTGKNGLSNGILLEVHLVHFRLSLAAYRTSRFSAPLACRSYPKLLETQARQYQLCICVEHPNVPYLGALSDDAYYQTFSRNHCKSL